MTFVTESGVRRHILCVHARRYHRGRASSPVPPALLDAAVQRARMGQANSRQRRLVRALQQTPTAVATPVVDPTATDTEIDDLLGDLLQGWPDDQLLVPSPAVQRVVVREVASQHETTWADAATSTGRPSFNAGVQAGRPALTGPALLLDPGMLARLVSATEGRPDLPPDRLVEMLRTSSSDFAAVPRELLETIVTTSCRAQRALARQLLRQLGSGGEEPQARQAGFLAAYAMLEETAERSIGPRE